MRFCWGVWWTNHFHSIRYWSTYSSKGWLTYSPPSHDLKHLMGRPHCVSAKEKNSLNLSKTRFLFFKKNTYVKQEKSSMKFKMYLALFSEGKLIERTSLWTSSSRLCGHYDFTELKGLSWCFQSTQSLHTPSKGNSLDNPTTMFWVSSSCRRQKFRCMSYWCQILLISLVWEISVIILDLCRVDLQNLYTFYIQLRSLSTTIKFHFFRSQT